MVMIAALVTWYLVVTVPATIPFFLAARLHLWREYYTKLNDYTPSPRYIDTGDKVLALVVAWLAALIWPVTIPAFVIHRALVMRARKRAAYRYAASRPRSRYWMDPRLWTGRAWSGRRCTCCW